MQSCIKSWSFTIASGTGPTHVHLTVKSEEKGEADRADEPTFMNKSDLDGGPTGKLARWLSRNGLYRP